MCMVFDMKNLNSVGLCRLQWIFVQSNVDSLCINCGYACTYVCGYVEIRE